MLTKYQSHCLHRYAPSYRRTELYFGWEASSKFHKGSQEKVIPFAIPDPEEPRVTTAPRRTHSGDLRHPLKQKHFPLGKAKIPQPRFYLDLERRWALYAPLFEGKQVQSEVVKFSLQLADSVTRNCTGTRSPRDHSTQRWRQQRHLQIAPYPQIRFSSSSAPRNVTGCPAYASLRLN